MLSFGQPWLIVAGPMLAWAIWALLRKPTPALVYSDVSLLDNLPPGRARWHWVSPLFKSTSLVLLLLAAMGPRLPDHKTRLPADGLAMVLALDLSGSMATTDFGTPPLARLEAARQVFTFFVQGGTTSEGVHFSGRSRDQLGLVTFAAVPETACPLTHNHRVLMQILQGLKPKNGVDAGTNIGDAIAESAARLEAGRGRNPVIILLSDGEHNIHVDRPDRPLMPRESALLAKALGIKIYAIDCGGEPGANASPEERQQRLDGRKVLEAITEQTQGKTFLANDVKELAEVLKQIDELETESRPTFRYRRYHELGWWLALAGVGCFAGSFFLDRILWRRVI